MLKRAVFSLLYEAKALLEYFAFKQSFLANGKIAPAVLFPHKAKKQNKHCLKNA